MRPTKNDYKWALNLAARFLCSLHSDRDQFLQLLRESPTSQSLLLAEEIEKIIKENGMEIMIIKEKEGPTAASGTSMAGVRINVMLSLEATSALGFLLMRRDQSIKAIIEGLLLAERERAPMSDDTQAFAVCIGCGCDDLHACGGSPKDACSWVRLDWGARLGVCSRCQSSVERWDAGDRDGPASVLDL